MAFVVFTQIGLGWRCVPTTGIVEVKLMTGVLFLIMGLSIMP